MKIEEQIFAYKELRNNGQAFFIDNYEDADRIIEALEKQVPKKPTDVDEDYGKYKCCDCGMVLYATDNMKDHNYCLNCGQAIDWGDLDG